MKDWLEFLIDHVNDLLNEVGTRNPHAFVLWFVFYDSVRIPIIKYKFTSFLLEFGLFFNFDFSEEFEECIGVFGINFCV